MKLINFIRWYFLIRRIRYKNATTYPINKKHIWKIAKFMCNVKA